MKIQWGGVGFWAAILLCVAVWWGAIRLAQRVAFPNNGVWYLPGVVLVFLTVWLVGAAFLHWRRTTGKN